MRIRLFIAALVFSLFPFNSAFAQIPKAGAKCAVQGIEKVYKGKKFVCEKKGKKLLWRDISKQKIENSSSQSGTYDFRKTYSTDDGYLDNYVGGPCSFDPNVPPEWVEMQNFYKMGCSGPFRLAKYELGKKLPVSKFDESTNFKDITKCKNTTQPDYKGLSHNIHPWRLERRYPSPNTIVQLIPIFGPDTQSPKNSPLKDYGKYLEFLREWIDYSSDFGSKSEIRIPEKYLEFNNYIAEYNLSHPVNWDTPGHVKFNRDVITAVDEYIDFTGANIGIVVAPPGTDASIMQQAALGSFRTNEGTVPVVISQFADIPSNPQGSKYSGLTHPFWWIHELYHAGFGLDDHYGDTKNDINTDYGMGWWTMMTPWGGDLSIWEKWILGFVQDSQIQCKYDDSTTTHWIAPSSVYTQQSKAVVIPVSDSKVIVVESIKPAGLYYKIPTNATGLLVYEIDFSVEKHGYGMKLSLPTNRKINNWEFSSPVFLGGALLKARSSDSTSLYGFRITAIESGTFGDVVKVEKI